MKKGLLLLLLFVVVGLSAVRAYDFSAVSPSGHTLYYEIISGTANVGVVRPGIESIYNNYVSGSVVIPAPVAYNGTTYNVTELRSIYDNSFSFKYGTFEKCDSLTSVTIPKSVTSIGHSAFEHCVNLISVSIPNSVTSIGKWAFSNCSLTSITIPNSLTSIENGVFNHCTDLTSVTIPNSITSIEDNAFDGCIGLTSVTIPNSITTIGNCAFSNCIGLTCVTIPNGVTSIGESTFYGCRGLTSITIPNSVTSIKDNAFYGCTGLTSITIPNSVTNIEEGAFAYCDGLTSITIPNSVTSIKDNAFYGCTGLASVTIPNSVTTIGHNAFYWIKHIIYNGTAIGNPWGALSINGFIEHGFVYFDNTKKLLLAYIGTDTNVTIPNSVSTIGYTAFAYYSDLTSVSIPNSVTSIEEGAFAYCDGLTSITIPNSVTSIGEAAFFDCTSLTTLNFNAINCTNFSTNSYHPFYNCPISTINIGDSVQQLPNKFIMENTTLTTLTLGCNLASIPANTFSGCSSLQNVRCFSKTPPTIDNSVFPNPNTAILFVPDGSIDAYSSPTSYWNMFFGGRIREN